MSAGIESICFLIVEDHPFQLQTWERALRSLGAVEIRSAANGAEAMQLVRDFPVDVVISDVLMPEVDGIEMISKLAALERAPWLILTSSADWALDAGHTIAEGRGLRVLGSLRKPLTAENLKPLIASYLAQARQSPL